MPLNQYVSMTSATDAPSDSLTAVVAFLSTHAAVRSTPLVVALDGRSGAGKSTIARGVAAMMDVAVVSLDDFFAASVPSAQWDAWTPGERADNVVDWARVRSEVLVPLRASRPARWQPFDFAAGPRADGSYGLQRHHVSCPPRPIVLLDGAYSASPALADLVDVTILVEAAPSERASRLAAREDPAFLASWHARWDAVEAHYANVVRPRDGFDLVVGHHDRHVASSTLPIP